MLQRISIRSTVLCSACPLALASAADALIDLNSNGICDIWEHRYQASSLVDTPENRASDSDGDGQSNQDESMAGTDPRDPESVHQISDLLQSGSNILITSPTQAGKTYQIYSSTNLLEWTPQGSATLADGERLDTILNNQDDEHTFYRMVAIDTDTDLDGIPDWAERQLSGFDPERADSFAQGSGLTDRDLLLAQLTAIQNGEITLSASTDTAFEKENTSAAFTLNRSGDTSFPLTLFFHWSGHSNPSKGSASASDFTAKNNSGEILTRSITIPAGASSTDLIIHPNSDFLTEVPETLTCTLGNTSINASIRICDATNIPSNATLFVAQLAPTPDINSSASGLATILVQGDNEIGSINLSFSGLTSPQPNVDAAHVHLKNPINGPHFETLDKGQIDAHPWSFAARHFLTSDQAVLDALHNSRFYINVHTENFPSGEIRGDFHRTNGSFTLLPPPTPPAVTPLTGDALDRDIARFLTQSTFGPTTELVTELRNRVINDHGGDRIAAFSAWIDQQIAMESPSLLHLVESADKLQIAIYTGDPEAEYYDPDYEPSDSNRRRGWWQLALYAPDQLRQRAAFALSEIFVTSSADGVVDDRHLGHSHYYDALKNHAFGSYQNLLKEVSIHPIMGYYLSHLRNRKAIYDGEGNILVAPDENYAREIMQLFSIGLLELHLDGSAKLDPHTGLPIATYDQSDIKEMARVFTGWSFSMAYDAATDSELPNDSINRSNGGTEHQTRWLHPMKVIPDYHDTGSKFILGQTINSNETNTGEQDLDAVVSLLSQHPNTAPFISRRLIQRLVTSNPSAGYIHRVSTVWNNSSGNLGAVIKAILLDYEARSLQAADSASFGKKKEPLIHAVALARATESQTKLPLNELDNHGYSDTHLFPPGTSRPRMNSTNETLGQTPLEAPSVFNWFLPDFTLTGNLATNGLVAPEFQISTENMTIANINVSYDLTYTGNGIGGSRLPNQADSEDHYLIPDRSLESQAAKAYLAIMDENQDGKVSSADSNTFDNPEKIREACTALTDHLDLLLCSGSLKHTFAGSSDANNPRDIIIETLVNYSKSKDDNDNDADQLYVLERRIKVASYLIATSPQSIIQK
ncbi:DUF1800 family protein [Verrucomicrobiaceae bacterium N1E253]|uniref:DUF1800 family protein n=1 Tax=Oceaniferula marina TaxID=2748318 RepID=A0A851GS53_9BACT|nr:DUF1800 family protein [Oceaniferula marina]NWK57610.1 DUF1800 family protein [Oceaniferula marina]